jgi:hypothetical protein
VSGKLARCGFIHRTPLEACACLRCEYLFLLDARTVELAPEGHPSGQMDNAQPSDAASTAAARDQRPSRQEGAAGF